MTDCVESQKLIERLIDGQDDREDLGELEAHVARCRVCSELYTLHRDLIGLEKMEALNPDASDLLEMRREVVRTIRKNPVGSASSASGWLAGPFRRPALAAALCLTLLVIGFFVGMGGPKGMRPSAPERETLTQEIELAATRNKRLVETENSPYVYSNVQVKELDAETIALSFDVATHMDLIRPKNDPLVTEVLVQSLVSQSSLGTRLDAISFAPTLEPKVRDALIAALLEDSDLAVRLKALDKLTAHRDVSEVKTAFLNVLKREESVQARLLAIDNLTAGRIRPEALTAALAEGPPEPGNAIETRARIYLAEF
jgi:hypothetical protein